MKSQTAIDVKLTLSLLALRGEVTEDILPKTLIINVFKF